MPLTNSSDSIQLDGLQINKTVYSGQFIDNIKEGKFIKRYHFNDGIDWGENYTIELKFINNNCSSATFKGAIGFTMPKSTYQFDSLKECTFQQVRNLAWKRWEMEWNTRKETKNNE